jgi:hypothetical protein
MDLDTLIGYKDAHFSGEDIIKTVDIQLTKKDDGN